MPHERRVFIDLPENLSSQPNPELELSPEDSHHLRNVLRLCPGCVITAVSKSSGVEYEALLTNSTGAVRIKLLNPKTRQHWSSKVQSLIFALTKNSKNDLVCEKACELGVSQIIFWEAYRSVVSVASDLDRQKKIKRWRRIAESAAKQSGQTCIPEILLLSDLDELLATVKESASPSDQFLCCSLSPQARDLREMRSVPGRVHLVVGPEGDLTPEEEQCFVQHAFQPVSLGPFVLRSETAAITAIAMIQGLWGAVQQQPI